MIDFDCLPAVSAIYRVWHCNRVVYVGQAVNLKKRWKSHHILPKLISRYGLDWTIDWVQVDPRHLNRAEAFAYRCFSPELNQRNPSEQLGLTCVVSEFMQQKLSGPLNLQIDNGTLLNPTSKL